MSLSQLAELACSKRPFSAIQYIEQLALPSSPAEPPRKKVRFEGAANAAGDDEVTMPAVSLKSQQAPQELEQLMEKVRQRAARRRTMMSSSSSSRTSYSPPPPQTVTVLGSSCNNKTLDLAAMQRKLERMEQVIKKTARAELHLMNQSKKLRDKRAGLTRKYESMAAQLAEMQQSAGNQGVVFQMGVLPPLMDKPRRVSATREQIRDLACSM